MKNKIIKFIKKNKRVYFWVIKRMNKFFNLVKNNAIIRFIYLFFTMRKSLMKEKKSIFSYVNQNDLKYIKCNKNMDTQVYIPKYMPNDSKDEIRCINESSILIVKLNNISVIPYSNFIYNENYIFNDKFDLTYSNFIKFDNFPVYKEHDNKLKFIVKRKKKRISKGIHLIGEASNNFYHWIFDILSKLIYINDNDEFDDYPVLIDETVSINTNLIDFLKLVDLKKHEIVVLKKSKTYLVNELIYVSPVTWSSVYFKSGLDISNLWERFAKDKYVLDRLRTIMYEKCKNVNIPTIEKIVITRASNKTHRLLNESDMISISNKYGFVDVEPSRYTILEQVYLFSHAKYIIAASGAALVNLLWCKNCKLLCISPSCWRDYNYSTIAYMQGVRCVYFDGIMEDSILHKIDIIEFEKYLKNDLKEELI